MPIHRSNAVICQLSVIAIIIDLDSASNVPWLITVLTGPVLLDFAQSKSIGCSSAANLMLEVEDVGGGWSGDGVEGGSGGGGMVVVHDVGGITVLHPTCLNARAHFWYPK